MSSDPSTGKASASQTGASQTSTQTTAPKSSQQLLGDALTQLKKLKAELAALKHRQNMPIAVIGMSCRYPGGVTTQDAFWKLLNDGVSGISEIDDTRWEMENLYDANPSAPGRIYTKSAGLLDGIELFDGELFGISAVELQNMDPQHRVFMEAAWTCIENAGYAPSMLAGKSVGIYVGIGTQDFSQLSSRFGAAENISPWNGTGVSFSAVGGRLAYLLDLHGPAVPVDTACSSSLVALHQAVNGLRQHECDSALVSGVMLMLNPATSILFCKAMMLSPDGRCKSFDAAADGYVRGEGCGAVMLKRLDDALRDGDNILALIRGTAVNQDGRTQGLTAPNESAQVDVIRRAIANAGIDAHDVSLIEAHGTGTSLGDPIEMAALATAYCTQRAADNTLWVGSLKTNVGHMEAAAGVGGLQKVVLALQNQSIPPHLNFTVPSPHIDWHTMPQVKIPLAATQWHPATQKPRIAGLSSFGFTGTNAHVVIEQAPTQPEVDAPAGTRLFKLSGTRLAALRDSIRNHIDHLQQLQGEGKTDATTFARICYTANRGRNDFRYRLTIIADDIAQLLEQLQSLSPLFDEHADDEDGEALPALTAKIAQASPNVHLQKAPVKAPSTAFMFAGQGSQQVGMAQKLYQQLPVFKLYFDQCDALFSQHAGISLQQLMWGDHSDLLGQTQHTQPALFAIEYALAKVFVDSGIKPSAVIGHSVGEYAAACIAGVFSLADAMKLICARGKLMQELAHPGGMTAVFATQAQVEALLGKFPQLSIAVRNAETNLVVGGDTTALTELEMQLAAHNIKYRRLNVSHAFHTATMQPMLKAFADVAATVSYRAPRIRFISSVSAKSESAKLATPQYWVEQVMACVDFVGALRAIIELAPDNLLEIGPDRTLCGLARQMINGASPLILASQMPKQEIRGFYNTLAQLYSQGHSVDWNAFYQGSGLRVLTLPNYAFQKRIYWHPEMPVPRGRRDGEGENPLVRSLYRHEWQKKALLPSMDDNASANWLVFCNEADAATLSQAFAQAGQTATCISNRDAELADEQAALALVADWLAANPAVGGILLASTQHDASDVASSQRFYTAAALHVLKALIALKPALAQRAQQKLPVWFYSPSEHQSSDSASSASASTLFASTALQRGIWGGIVNVVALEHPEFLGGYIEADTLNGNDIVLELTQGDAEDQIRYVQGQRHVARLRSAEKSLAGNRALNIEADFSYLVTGGLGSLGLGIARTLAQAGARHLVLLSRRGFDANTATPAQIETLQQLQELGVSVECPAVDAGDRAALQKLIESLNASTAPLRGIVHAAGVFDLTAIAELDMKRCGDIMDGKVQGGLHLHELTLNSPLDFFVNFSSIASVWGSAGNFHYAAANRVLDVIAEQRKLLGLPITNINWGPWAQSAMAVDNEDEAAKRGLIPIDMQQGLALFARMVGSASIGAVVADVRWTQFLQLMQLRGRRPVFDRVHGDAQGAAASVSSYVRIGLLEKLQALPSTQQAAAIADYLADQISSAAGIERKYFDIDAPLMGLGLDSLMALELRNRVKTEFEIELPVTLLLEGASTSVLAAHLHEALADALSATNGAAAAPVAAATQAAGPTSEKEMLEGEL